MKQYLMKDKSIYFGLNRSKNLPEYPGFAFLKFSQNDSFVTNTHPFQVLLRICFKLQENIFVKE
ncbi:MAG: hypothetical protein C5B52_14900 [Bacteroidetes bacterium]|nr:MAG: hypothetical protein C5B52_14900 [Bacteroidota bacterium]